MTTYFFLLPQFLENFLHRKKINKNNKNILYNQKKVIKDIASELSYVENIIKASIKKIIEVEREFALKCHEQ